jgi:hypothetical protein
MPENDRSGNVMHSEGKVVTMQPSSSSPLAVDSFTQRGGYRVGSGAFFSLNATWPFGALEVVSGKLVLHCITRQFVFPEDSITGLSRYNGLFSEGLRIEHTVPGYPRFVVFWTSDIGELQRQLVFAGFKICSE